MGDGVWKLLSVWGTKLACLPPNHHGDNRKALAGAAMFSWPNTGRAQMLHGRGWDLGAHGLSPRRLDQACLGGEVGWNPCVG